MATLRLSMDPDADKLLSDDPLALLIGMVLDQQIPLEWAFTGPKTIRDRLGHDLDVKELASMDPDAFVKVCLGPPAVHRFPAANAQRIQDLCQIIVDEYDGDAAAIWDTAADGKELLKRVKALPGFGDMKAKIFVALLGKQLKVTPKGWKEAAGDFAKAGTFMSVADITDEKSLGKVRSYKQQKKAAAKAAAAANES